MAFLALEVQWVMGLLFWVLLLLCWDSSCAIYGGELFVNLTAYPRTVSSGNATAFSFEPVVDGKVVACSDCTFSCKLDSGPPSDCPCRKVPYGGLLDGDHSFEVCVNGSQGSGCAYYNWTIDTIPPTADVTTSASITRALNVSVIILFSEPCIGGGGFRCPSVDACNLLVYGAGQVIPPSLRILQPNLEYTLSVSLNSTIEHGRVDLTMDENFCTDNAGNRFTRTSSSNNSVQIGDPRFNDRTSVSCDLRTSIPKKTIQLKNQYGTVQATSNQDNLRIYLNFSEPVANSAAEILDSLNTSQGTLLPIDEETLGNQIFRFMVANVPGFAIITIGLKSESIITRQGTAVSPLAPITILYDPRRPTADVSTTSTSRTRETEIPFIIEFGEAVFGFNSNSITISGGCLQSFGEISKRRYNITIKADDGIVSVRIRENVTSDIAGNKNLPSNVLHVRHYSVPTVSLVPSVTSTAAFFTASLAAGLLSVSTASLRATGAFTMTSSTSTSNPSTDLFRMVCHVQVFALSRWLAADLPVEYDELARYLQWSIPYFSLPWEFGHVQPPASSTSHLSDVLDLETVGTPKEEKLSRGLKPLSAWEIKSFLEMENSTSEVADPQHNNGWRDFGRNMFWLVIIDGSLIFLHALLLLILTCKKKTTEKQDRYRALILPRLEMRLLMHALPCVSQASSALIRGRTPSGMVVGILLLGLVAFELLSLFLFLSVGITFGKLLQYKEVHQGGRRIRWHRELIREILGPGENGQWTWKQNSDSVCWTIFGPLFEDLRGPPENILSQICGASPREDDRLTASDGGTEDAKAPLILKMFGILRIYYPLLECIKRVTLGIFAGTDWTSRHPRTPKIALLCITSFQLLFLVLKKPFRNKKVQLVEIISVSAELGTFVCAVISSKKLSIKEETGVGNFMVALAFIALAAQMVNMWDALYRQIKRLDPDGNSFRRGLKVAFHGVLVLLTPEKRSRGLESKLPEARRSGGETGDPGSSARSELQETSSPTDE